MQLILVRHALPHRVGQVHGPTAVLNGVADPALTPLGHRQAARVGKALAREAVTAVYTSPQRRAQQSAEPLSRMLDLVPTVTAGLAEYDSNDPYYIPVHQMAEADPEGWRRFLVGQLPEHVDVDAYGSTVQGAIREIVSGHSDSDTVVCFAHHGTINIYLAGLLNLDRPLTFALDYTGITRVMLSPNGHFDVRTVNEISHVADLLDPEAVVEEQPTAGR